MPCVQSDAFSLRTARCVLACVVSAILLLGTLGPGAAESKRVLMLHSFGRDFKPWSEYARNIRAELEQQSLWPLEISDHSTASSGDEKSEAPLVEYLRALHAEYPPDVIVSLGAPAVAFVQRYRQQLFPATPMVFTAVEQRRVRYSDITASDTVVAVAHSFREFFESILRVLPYTKTVAVVIGSSPNEKFWLGEIEREGRQFAGRITFKWYNEFSFEDILKDAAALPPQSVIFWHLLNVDAAGVGHEGDEALQALHAVHNAPIFAVYDTSFGNGIVGGPMHSAVEGRHLTASVGLGILGGERAGDIKVPPTGFAEPKFDWREVRRWGINESRLMPGSQIYFREPTVWEQYRPQILMVCAVILLQSALLCWLLYQRARGPSSKAPSNAAGQNVG